MFSKSILLAVSAATLAIAGSPFESGSWNEQSPGYSTQTCEGGMVSGSTFYLPKSKSGSASGGACSNGHLRAERRYNDDYSSGTHQFGGEFKVNSGSGSRISIKQTFNGDAGPYFILGWEQGGRLYDVEGGATICDSCAPEGTTVSLHTVHNADNKRFSCYVNGKEMFRDNSAPGGSFYDKIGTYQTDSGTGDLSVTWSDVQFWTK